MAPAYDPASLWWGRQEPITVWDRSRTKLLLSIPYNFLRTSGDFTYAFVLFITKQMFEEDGHLQQFDGDKIELSSQPDKGSKCCYISPDVSDERGLHPRRGPESKSAMIKAASTASLSTYSDSKNASQRSGQSKFRSSLLSRDGRCILTHTHRDLCTAAHIVPVSRLDVYQELLGVAMENECYQASMGFLIKDEWHGAYDRYEWSWYFKDGMYYPHFFALKDPQMRQYQGQRLDPGVRMRSEPEEFPDPVLCNWHYRQCVLARIRAVALGFPSPLGQQG